MLNSFFSYDYTKPTSKPVKNGDAILVDDWNNNFYALSKAVSNLVNAFSNNSNFYTWQNVNDWKAQLKTDIAYNMNPQSMSWGNGELTINSNGITNKTITINDATFTYTNTNTLTIGDDKIEIKNGNTVLYTTEQNKDQTILTSEMTSGLIDERFKFTNVPTVGIVKKWTLKQKYYFVNNTTNGHEGVNTVLDLLNNQYCFILGRWLRSEGKRYKIVYGVEGRYINGVFYYSQNGRTTLNKITIEYSAIGGSIVFSDLMNDNNNTDIIEITYIEYEK